MNRKNTIGLILVVVITFGSTYILGENIDPDEDGSQYSWGENVGWLNFEPNVPDDPCDYGVTVSSTELVGYVWAENIGWINLFPLDYGGVFNDGLGNLTGFAWAENVGWINFDPNVPGDPTRYGVSFDCMGNFTGWAWGENIGWIRFDSSKPYNVKVSMDAFDCMAIDHPDRAVWERVGKPSCWCCPHQCHGDTNNQFAGKDQDGKHEWVKLVDLQLLGQGWGQVDSAGGVVGPWICADFSHTFAGKDQDGKREWVDLGDLQILGFWWGKTDCSDPPPACGPPPDCQTASPYVP